MKHYSNDFKDKVVAEYTKGGATLNEVAKKYKIYPCQIYQWRLARGYKAQAKSPKLSATKIELPDDFKPNQLVPMVPFKVAAKKLEEVMNERRLRYLCDKGDIKGLMKRPSKTRGLTYDIPESEIQRLLIKAPSPKRVAATSVVRKKKYQEEIDLLKERDPNHIVVVGEPPKVLRQSWWSKLFSFFFRDKQRDPQRAHVKRKVLARTVKTIKAKVIQESLVGDVRDAEIALKYNIGKSTVSNWRTDYLREKGLL